MYIGLEVNSDVIDSIPEREYFHYKEIAKSNYERQYKNSQNIIKMHFI